MIRDSVKSSNIKAIGYDAANGVLEVEFHPNREGVVSVWRYSPVDATDYASLIGAPSIGARFNAIRRTAGLRSELVERYAREAKTEIPVADDAAASGQP